jgi:hypothetical protein
VNALSWVCTLCGDDVVAAAPGKATLGCSAPALWHRNEWRRGMMRWPHRRLAGVRQHGVMASNGGHGTWWRCQLRPEAGLGCFMTGRQRWGSCVEEQSSEQQPARQGDVWCDSTLTRRGWWRTAGSNSMSGLQTARQQGTKTTTLDSAVRAGVVRTASTLYIRSNNVRTVPPRWAPHVSRKMNLK